MPEIAAAVNGLRMETMMTALKRLQKRPLDPASYGLADAVRTLRDPNELLTRTEAVTLPRWLWERIDRGQIVWTDLRRL